jgi:LPS-assembly lipoprotein
MTRLPALAATLVLGLSAVGLSACSGFTPLYAAPGVTSKMSAIEVVRPDGRLGFLMGGYLEDSLGKNQDQAPVYRLTYANREVRVPQGISISNVATRYEVDVTSQYSLIEIATRKVVTSGHVTVNVTYDVVSSPYDELQSVQDGERRVAEQAADRMRIELATWFAAPRPTAPNAPTAADLATYSDRLQPSVIQSPRERALGEPTPQAGQSDIFGQPLQTTVRPDTQTSAFSPSQDPNNTAASDPTGIKTIPDTSGQ